MPSSMIPRRHFHLSNHSRSVKIRFAYRFLRALKKLNNYKNPNPDAPNTYHIPHRHPISSRRRYHMVKTAAYASMAAAVGTKRAWSRALLRKIRNNNNNNNKQKSKLLVSSKKIMSMMKLENPSSRGRGELEKLVPGGEVMDFCSLLDETAHYIKCLTSQVQIMRNIVDFYSL